MIIVTGGAGFIGSALIWQLNKRGIVDILVVDHLGESEKWRNLVKLDYTDFMEKSLFIKKLESGEFGTSIDSIFHLGACSSTMELNADYLIENNFHYTLRLAQWSINQNKVKFIYASSAATYGAGECGYSDDVNQLSILKPLNMYGYSKHLFDMYAQKRGWLKEIVGLKFFNVFGPNEYHKADMRSLICKSYPKVRDEGRISLFKSYNTNYKDGEQIRDFIYVKDAVEMILFFHDNPKVSGIFNIGSGVGHSWNELASALFSACGKQLYIDYVPMPEILKAKYQYFTQADMTKIRAAGCMHKCMTLENSVNDYVNTYLENEQYLGEE